MARVLVAGSTSLFLEETAYGISPFKITSFHYRSYTIATFPDPFKRIGETLRVLGQRNYLSISPRTGFGLDVFDQDKKIIQTFYMYENGYKYIMRLIRFTSIETGNQRSVFIVGDTNG